MKLKLSDYEEIIGQDKIEELNRLADKVRGQSMLHISSTFTGGGVAEMLHSLVPLFNQLGIDTIWQSISGPPRFFEITKKFHNVMQGGEEEINQEMLDFYLENNRHCAERLYLKADIVVVHDPQPASLIESRPINSNRWIWRCHIYMTEPHQRVWNFLLKFINKYDIVIFSSPEFAKYLPIPQDIVPPSIDPMSDKNKEISDKIIDDTYDRYKVPRDKPILLQISRFDRFKDPLGVTEAYQMVKKDVDCRLVLAGGAASDDPEGLEMLRKVREKTADDPDVFILPPAGMTKMDAIEINALQRGADVIVQKSLKEAFALTITEALWKGKPVVASAVGGIKLQILDGKTGFLVNSIPETADRVKYLLENPKKANKLGIEGREHVRENFLISRHLRDYLRLLSIISPS